MDAVTMMPAWSLPVPKPPADDKPPYEPPTETIRIDRDLVEMARVVCLHTRRDGKKVKLSDYIGEMIRERITKDHDEALQAIADARAGKKKPQPKKEG